jgi:SAM-dependent methyltransferase
MEHIPDIEAAFSEMVRVCRPGGILYCVSAPLWNSRNGHHKSNFFDSYPWIHLRMDEREIIAYCAAHGIADTTGNLPMSVHIAYMLDAAYFNKQPARKYVETCAKLNKMIIICNELEFDDKKILTPDIYQELRPKGYTSEELLAIVHTYIGRKNKGKHHFWLPVIPRLKRLLKKSVSLRKTVTTS